MEINAQLIAAIIALAGVVVFLFSLYNYAVSKQVEELKKQLEERRKELIAERKKVADIQSAMQDDLEKILTSNIEVVRSNTSVLNKILNDK